MELATLKCYLRIKFARNLFNKCAHQNPHVECSVAGIRV